MKATQQVALDMGCNYIYDEWGRINLHADKVRKGEILIAETLPTNGVIDTQFMPIVKTSKTQIFAFLKHCDLDFEGAQVGAIIDEMLGIAKEFVVRLDGFGVYEPLNTTIDYNAVIDFLDANMAGVRLTLELKELKGECV